MKEDFVDLSFPLAGLDVSQRFGKQPVRQLSGGVYGRTTAEGVNVRGYEPSTGRLRGGSRSGLSRYINAKVNSTNLIQNLSVVVGTGYTDPAGGTQTSEVNRIVNVVAVSAGEVKVASPGATAWTAVTNGTGYTVPLTATGVIRSAVLNQKVYFADGARRVLYDPSDNQLETWNASGGTFPSNSAGTQYPRLICLWRGRLVLSALESDPQNYFATKIDDATDFNYTPDVATADQAFAGNNGPLGLVGDVVTSLIPFNDDVIIFGCDSSVYAMNGDPFAGGQIDRIVKGTGMAFDAWCMDDKGNIFFLGQRGGFYAMTPGSQPQRISQPVEQHLRDINTGTHAVRMVYDDRMQGMHIFITKISAAAATTHFYWEARSAAWWMDEFASTSHNPLATCVFDGNLQADRTILLGSWDGYVRSVDEDATTDDGTDIESSVVLGPIISDTFDEMLIRELQAIMGEESGDVTFAIHVGSTAEAALAADAIETGTFEAGRNPTSAVRCSAHAIIVRLTSTARWNMEQLKIFVSIRGKVKRRAMAS